MKITAIELFQISVPLAVPYKLSKVYGTVHDARAVIVRLLTDAGITGYGEADPMPPFTDESPGGVMVAIRDFLGPRLVGQDPRNVNGLEAVLDQTMVGNHTAKGALSMALYDVLGKATELPVYALLGGAMVRELPVLWPLGSGTPEEDAALIDRKMAEGYRTFGIKMGALPVADEIVRVHRLKQRFDAGIHLLVDANQGWDLSEAVEFVHGVRPYRLGMIEQPVASWDVDGLKRLRAIATSPISADESLVSLDQGLRLIREQAVDIFSLKVSKNGGLGAVRKLAVLAEAAGLRCLMNSMLEFGITQAASLHVGVTLRNLAEFGHAYMSTLRLADDITDFSARVEGGVAKVPDQPGLGVAIDEDKLAKYAQASCRVDARGNG